MRLRVCPPMVVKAPPAKILPSACTAIPWTKPFAFGSHESAAPVTASSRAMRLRVATPMPVKVPPAKTLPSVCTAITRTKLFAFGSKAVSSVPSGFSRAMRLRVTPKTVVKSPPIRILPSGWTTTTRIDAVRVRIETVERGLPAHRRRAARQQHGNGKQQERSFPGSSGCCSRK